MLGARGKPIAAKDPTVVVVASVWSMLLLSTIFLVLRVYCRAFRLRKLWYDDYLLIAGWVREIFPLKSGPLI